MKKKSIIAMFLTLGMLFSACGGNQAEVADGTESVPMEDFTQQNGGEPAQETLPGGKVELKVGRRGRSGITCRNGGEFQAGVCRSSRL